MELKSNEHKRIVVGGSRGEYVIPERYAWKLMDDRLDAFAYATRSILNKQEEDLFIANNTEDVEYTDVTNDPRYEEGAEEIK